VVAMASATTDAAARGRAGVTGPQLGRGDHRRRVRSTDRATNGFEPRNRSWYPPTLAWPNEAPLLLAVQATQQGVDVDERDHPRTGQQRRTAAELDQELARRRTRRPHRPAVHSGLRGRSRSGRNSRTSTRPASPCIRNAAAPPRRHQMGREPAKAWSSKTTTTLASQRNQRGRVARFPSLAWWRFQWAIRWRQAASSTFTPGECVSRTSRWLDPATYRRWRDFGLFALERGGRQDVTFQSRSELRDAAFADGSTTAGGCRTMTRRAGTRPAGWPTSAGRAGVAARIWLPRRRCRGCWNLTMWRVGGPGQRAGGDAVLAPPT
jgi:hypothetical protein